MGAPRHLYVDSGRAAPGRAASATTCLYTGVASLVLTGLSGEGISSLGGFVNPFSDIVVIVTAVTNPKVMIVGSTTPKRLRFAGGYGLAFTGGFTDLSFSGTSIEYWETLDWEAQDRPVPALVGADSFTWRLQTGVTIDAEIFW